MKRIKNLLENPKLATGLSALIALLIGVIAYTKLGHAPKIDTSYLNNDETPSSTDNYVAGQEISLAFIKGGKIDRILAKTGDHVVKGQLLAEISSSDAKGAVTQAAAALDLAKANYDKVINGATGPEIDVAKAAVKTAQVNYDETVQQQARLVDNARNNLLNSGFSAVLDGNSSMDSYSNSNPPIISGSYAKKDEGQIVITTYAAGGGMAFRASGLIEGSGAANTSMPIPIGDSGLFIKFTTAPVANTTWIIDIPNKQSPSYIQNQNAYQAALATQTTAVQNANALLDQAKTALAAKQASARPEDVAIAKAQMDSAAGALSIARTNYDNMTIHAPTDGNINSINISVGAIVAPNQRAITMTVTK